MVRRLPDALFGQIDRGDPWFAVRPGRLFRHLAGAAAVFSAIAANAAASVPA